MCNRWITTLAPTIGLAAARTGMIRVIDDAASLQSGIYCRQRPGAPRRVDAGDCRGDDRRMTTRARTGVASNTRSDLPQFDRLS